MAVVSFTQGSVLDLWSRHRDNFVGKIQHDDMCRGPNSVWSCHLCSSISWMFRNKVSVVIDGTEYVQKIEKGTHKIIREHDSIIVDPVTCHALLSWYLISACPRAIPKVLVNTWCKSSHRVTEVPGMTLSQLAKSQRGLSAEIIGGIFKQLIVYLDQLKKFKFYQYSITMDNLMFYLDPVAFKYKDRKIIAPVMVKFGDLSHSSITLGEGVSILPDIPIARESQHNQHGYYISSPIAGYWQDLCNLGLRDLIEGDQWLKQVDEVICYKDQDPELLELVLETIPKAENAISKIN